MPTLTIGCFELTQVSRLKWRVYNTLAKFEYTTYGTREELEEQLGKQSKDWDRRLKEGKGVMHPATSHKGFSS